MPSEQNWNKQSRTNKRQQNEQRAAGGNEIILILIRFIDSLSILPTRILNFKYGSKYVLNLSPRNVLINGTNLNL